MNVSAAARGFARRATPSFGPRSNALGPLRSRTLLEYGLSWQIIPRTMGTLLRTDDAESERHVTDSFPTMKKLDVAALERGAAGEPR